jgi:ABC-type antimicrobial peptide transport system permease subunit
LDLGSGIYGLMAYSVQQRMQEIGIRIALGAASANVRKMVVVQGMKLALAGIVIAVTGSIFLTRLSRPAVRCEKKTRRSS